MVLDAEPPFLFVLDFQIEDVTPIKNNSLEFEFHIQGVFESFINYVISFTVSEGLEWKSILIVLMNRLIIYQ